MNVEIKKKTIRYSEVLHLGKKNFSARGRPEGVGPPSVNLGPPNISESKRARKLKLKTPLDIVKYSPRVQKKFPLGAYGGHRVP